MEPDEEVVSDIHLFLTEQNRIHKVPDRYFGKYPVFRSRFLFRDINSSENETDPEVLPSGTSGILDEDGDLILSRRNKPLSEVINIEHAMSTHLPDVGLQVWPGCMILCDFIVDNRKAFDSKVVLELGAGVGLASIVSSMFAKQVIATDVNDDVLMACSNNVALNKHLFSSDRFIDPDSDSPDKPSNLPVVVRKLNWDSIKTGADEIIDCDAPFADSSFLDFPYQMKSTRDVQENSEESLLDLNRVDILIASDVVYSDDATDAFFRTVYEIMRHSSRCKTLYMSIEKRLNFTLEDLDIACPAYEHFRDCVTYICGLMSSAGEKFMAEVVPSIPQYFEYNRSKYLELWKITSEKYLNSSGIRLIV